MLIKLFNALNDYMNADQMIRSGGDLNLSGGKAPTSTTDATDVSVIRRAAKNILYTVVNSCAMNGYADGVVWAYTTPWWVFALIALNGVMFIISFAVVTKRF